MRAGLLAAFPLLAVLALAWPRGAAAQEERSGPRLSALAFGDAYGVISSHRPELEGDNGFWFRRLYLTLDHAVDDRLSGRLRLEAASPGDFTSNDRLEPFVKDAWIQWRYAGRHLLQLGLIRTPTWELAEETWGERPLEKAPMDLQRMGSSRDTGIAFKGKLGAGARLAYHVMLGNGSGVGSETNEGKKVMGSLSFRPIPRVVLEVYADHENRPGRTDRTTLHLFGAYARERWRMGAQVARQERETPGGGEESLDLASIYSIWTVTEKVLVIARADRLFDPNPEGATIPYLPLDPTARATLLMAGLDLRVHPNLSLLPNVEAVLYDGDGPGPEPDDDLMVRGTFFFRF